MPYELLKQALYHKGQAQRLSVSIPVPASSESVKIEPRVPVLTPLDILTPCKSDKTLVNTLFEFKREYDAGLVRLAILRHINDTPSKSYRYPRWYEFWLKGLVELKEPRAHYSRGRYR